jgi:N-acylglucosamine-6-phosphate 2-epimerase
MESVIDALQRTLIVSCQALPDEPLFGSIFMKAMARAAAVGGAGAIRANGVEDIAAIRAAMALPILGINKRKLADYEVFITPAYEDALAVVLAGANIIALDGTPRPRPEGEKLPAIIGRIHNELAVPVMADVSCLDDALFAADAGADLIATTLSGYTAHGRPALSEPDLEFISELVVHVQKPIVAEGRFHQPSQIAEAFKRGAYAVVVGGAITRPHEITRRFVSAIPA